MSIDLSAYADPSYFKMSLQSPMLVGVAGGADAGKHDLCKILMNRLSKSYAAKIHILSLTDFYRDLTPGERHLYETGQFNLDHPNVFDFEQLERTLQSLLSGQPTAIPVWNHTHHKRESSRMIEPVDVVLLEGTLVLYTKELRDLMFMKVFVDLASDQRLIQRVKKCKTRAGEPLTIKQLLTEYVEFVKPMFDDFIAPSKKYADIIVPRGVTNSVALQVLADHLEDHVRARSFEYTKSPRPEKSDDAESVGSGVSSMKSHRNDILATSAAISYKQIPQ